MTKKELAEMNIELSMRAQRELDNMADDADVDKFIRKHHITVEVNPDMVAWQEVQKARTALAELHKGEPVDLMLASAGLVEDDGESELEKKLRKIIADTGKPHSVGSVGQVARDKEIEDEKIFCTDV